MSGNWLTQKAGAFALGTALVAGSVVTASAQQNQGNRDQRMAARAQAQQQQESQRQADKQARQQQNQFQQQQQAQRQADKQARQQQNQFQQQQLQQQAQRQADKQARQQQNQFQQQQLQQQAQRQADKQARQQQNQVQQQQIEQQQIQRQADKQARRQQNQSQQQQAEQNNRPNRQAQPGFRGRGADQDQQRRIDAFRQRETQQERIGQQREQEMRNRGRLAGWRFEQRYLEHLREDRDRTAFAPLYFYYNAPRYRFERAGSFYTVESYAADVLRQAVELGYQQGFDAGQADSQDRFGYSRDDDFAYQDATYGYAGYVELPDYQYYFRQGFVRGYDDGYYGRYQFGVYSNGVVNIIGSILNQIFNPQPY